MLLPYARFMTSVSDVIEIGRAKCLCLKKEIESSSLRSDVIVERENKIKTVLEACQ